MIAADLTALLRIDLAQWGLRDPDTANLDATFDELGQRFAAGNTAAAAAPAVSGRA